MNRQQTNTLKFFEVMAGVGWGGVSLLRFIAVYGVVLFHAYYSKRGRI
jgi:hypothetical protein